MVFAYQFRLGIALIVARDYSRNVMGGDGGASSWLQVGMSKNWTHFFSFVSFIMQLASENLGK